MRRLIQFVEKAFDIGAERYGSVAQADMCRRLFRRYIFRRYSAGVIPTLFLK